MSGPLLFALDRSRELGERVAAALGLALAPHEEREFEDGEHKARPLLPVRGRDVFVLHGLWGEPGASANDKLCRLLFFCGALKENGAGRVTAITPYLAYARKDRQTKPRDPVTTRYLAQVMEAVGIDRVVTVDVHNLAAFQNAFRIESINLSARPLFVAALLPRLEGRVPVVVSPDAGGAKRAEALRELFEERLGPGVPLAFLQKKRSEGRVTGDAVIGEVKGRTAVILDDLISSGTTLARAAAALRREGAERIFACVTHGLFNPPAAEVIEEAGFERLLVTDSLPPFRLPAAVAARRLAILSIGPLLAEVVRRLHGGGSIGELLREGPQPSIAV